jgi:hypothetical protein
MSDHWQDCLCPFCGEWKRHKADCEWPKKLEMYEARKAAGEDPVVPDGIPIMCEMEDLISVLEAQEQTND